MIENYYDLKGLRHNGAGDLFNVHGNKQPRTAQDIGDDGNIRYNVIDLII